ncbi:hypothetical protein G7076_03280 [Sphingomonas sp. HDW15A]|uniref:hypothetical protein n=1 Tax=Sphingomonas sp. HDW15A TaxID=2714942 RepID=UPI001409A67D|nr:hypothetical protein [Sphingomonas sp. HDW15A]QIK95627.1 hypothetical protein G7076_03280 [Sphingomonas sp. HDW15A]
MIPDKVTQKIDHANAVFARLDQRDGSVRAAARREQARLNAGLATTAKRVAIAIGVISLITIVIGLIMPIGMFGFLAAVGIAIAVAAMLAVGGTRQQPLPTVPSDLPNGQMVQRFDSYIYRTRAMLPAPAQAEVDAMSAMLPTLRQTLERVPDLDPNAQDARRLMAKHLPGLIDSYAHVPASYRSAPDDDGKSADERLVEALGAGRQALKDIGDKLARNHLDAFETQGRFIETRYKDESLS